MNQLIIRLLGTFTIILGLAFPCLGMVTTNPASVLSGTGAVFDVSGNSTVVKAGLPLQVDCWNDALGSGLSFIGQVAEGSTVSLLAQVPPVTIPFSIKAVLILYATLILLGTLGFIALVYYGLQTKLHPEWGIFGKTVYWEIGIVSYLGLFCFLVPVKILLEPEYWQANLIGMGFFYFPFAIWGGWFKTTETERWNNALQDAKDDLNDPGSSLANGFIRIAVKCFIFMLIGSVMLHISWFSRIIQNTRQILQCKSENEKLKKDAEAGNPEAQFLMGVYFRDEIGDKATGFGWIQKSALSGFADAENELGVCLSQGIGCPPNAMEAAKYWISSVKKGNEDAMVHLAVAFLKGNGVAPNREKAVQLLTMAVKKGNEQAQEILDKLNTKQILDELPQL